MVFPQASVTVNNLTMDDWKSQFRRVVEAHASKTPKTGPVKQSNYELYREIVEKKQKKAVRDAVASARKDIKKKRTKKITYFFAKK